MKISEFMDSLEVIAGRTTKTIAIADWCIPNKDLAKLFTVSRHLDHLFIDN
jgi:hypothetical protein